MTNVANNYLEHPWNVKIDFFEGPLDVLLALIRNKKKQITDMQLTDICSPFLLYLNRRIVLDLDTDSSFIEVAATLILIKSNFLLPKPTRIEEVVDYVALEEDLKNQLIAYEKVKKLSLLLDEKDRLYRDFFCHVQDEQDDLDPSIEEKIVADIYNFALAYKRVLQRELVVKPYIFYETVWDVDGKIELIKKILTSISVVNFFDLCSSLSKHEIITSFMAVLEMARAKQIKINQALAFDNFSCIKLNSSEIEH